MSSNPKESYGRTFQRKVKRFEKQDLWYTTLPLDVMWGIYARQSTIAQVANNIESFEMQTEDLITWLVVKGVKEYYIILFDADLGKSGKLRIDQRTSLQELLDRIKSGEIKAVLVYRVSRLFRDESGAQPRTFARVCKENNCIIVTAADGMIFNLNISMHMKMFLYLADQAAEENSQRGEMMSQLKIRKAGKGLYAGLGRVPSGYIVDYDKKSKTFEKIIPYRPHAEIVFKIFKRYFELGGDFSALLRELDEWPYVFPEFEEWVDQRNVSRWKRRKLPGGGYKLTSKGLRQLLTNPVYIGWWIVMGGIISRDNHERIIPVEFEEDYFWFAFNRLSPYTTEGEVNTEQVFVKEPRRFYHKRTEEKTALLKQHATYPDGQVNVHVYRHRAHYCLLPTVKVRQKNWQEIEASLVDDAFLDTFFERLARVTELEDFRRWLEAEVGKQTDKMGMIDSQLATIKSQQEGIVDERIQLRGQIRDIKDNVQRERAELEARPTFEYLLKKMKKLEDAKNDLLRKRAEAQKSQGLDTARKYATFQIELREIVETWDEKEFETKIDFINLFVTKAILTLPASHFVQLDIFWLHPLWSTDTLYIYRKYGASPNWTDPELEILRQHYPRCQREELLAMLPFKTWNSIKKEAIDKGIRREIATASHIPDSLSWSDWTFMEEHGISPEILCSKSGTYLARYL